jgi:sirohydrochlorin ferrochelatase
MATVAPSPSPAARRVAGQTRVLLFRHGGKTSSRSPPPGELTAVAAAVALRGEEYHVVAAVEGHELETPEAEHRPGLKRLLKTTHLELNGKLFVNTQQAPTWRANCRRFNPGGSLDRRVNLSLRVPAQMVWREMEHKGKHGS